MHFLCSMTVCVCVVMPAHRERERVDPSQPVPHQCAINHTGFQNAATAIKPKPFPLWRFCAAPSAQHVRGIFRHMSHTCVWQCVCVATDYTITDVVESATKSQQRKRVRKRDRHSAKPSSSKAPCTESPARR